MKCVVVDPSPTIRRILRNVLHRNGFTEIVEGSDGRAALEKCDAGTSLVVTSWNVEGVDGIELTKRLRANPDTASIPVLMVTVQSVKDDILIAREAGVNAYLLKPFTAEGLRLRVEQILRPAGSAPVENTPDEASGGVTAQAA